MKTIASWPSVALAVALAACGGGGGAAYDGPPQIQITSPLDGQRVTGGVRTITVTGTGKGLAAVELRLNGVAVLPEAVTSTSTRFSATVELGDNANTIEAIATNDHGTASSGVVNVVYPFVRFSTFQGASVVVGQANFTSALPNRGGSRTASTLSAPIASLVAGGKLFVADVLNSRVLAYDAVPTTNGLPADLVLGQSSFTTAAVNRSASGYSAPYSLATTADKLLLKDDNRVLVFDAVPGASQAPADVVIGQDDFTSNAPGCAANRLTLGTGSIFAVDGKLLVAESNNNRVLIWNTIPTSSGTPADLVLGQQSFTTCLDNGDGGYAMTASTLSDPIDVWSDGARVVVTDHGNSRVLIWNSFPTANGQPADVVLGNEDFLGKWPSSGAPWPGYVTSNGNQLFLSESSQNRILVWNSIPTVNGYPPPDVVLGQSDVAHGAVNDDNQDGTPDAGPTRRTMNSPRGLTLSGNQLFVADIYNNRVLIFDAE